MKQNDPIQNGTSPSKAAKKRAKRAEKKAARNAVVSVHKRPIVCPPDKAGRHPLFRLGGLICRALVIWLASSGLVIFLADAIQSGVSSTAIFLCSLIVVALGMVFGHSGAGKLIASLSALGGVGVLAAIRPHLITDLPYGFLSLYNATLTRLNKLGYWSYAKFRVDITQFTDTSEDLLALEAMCIITVLITVLFVACLSKKVHLVPPAILATSLLAVVLTFNIYSNSIRSNLGVALVIVSFASVLVMGSYDRLYRRTDSKRYDTELRLFEDTDRPTLPPEYTDSKEKRAARRVDRADARRQRREKAVTVDEEITDYFNTGKTKKKAAAEPDEKPADALPEEEVRRRVRAVKKYDRVTEQSKSAMGGYAAAAVMLACLIAIALPALAIKGNFSTIPAIDEKMELARDYVTALLRGDEKALDRLDYQSDRDNFRPHSTTAEQLQFTGKQIFYIQTRYNTNFYLRGWIGLDYKDGAWHAVDEVTLNQYHQIFGENASPAEEMKYDFYYYMKPDLVGPTPSFSSLAAPSSEEVYPDYYLSHFGSHSDYGFVGTLVNLRRVNSPSSLTYFPVSFDPNYGLFEFESVTPNDLSYVNYYDGLYTGRGFDKNKLQYATIAYAPVMTDVNWINRLSKLQADYSMQKEALLALSGVTAGRDRLQLTVTESWDTYEFRYVLKGSRKNDPDTVWTTYHKANTVSRTTDETGARQYIVSANNCTLVLTMNGKVVTNAKLFSTGGQSLFERYNQNMTDEERTDLMQTILRDRDYTAFVYDTYAGKSGSDRIRDLAETIRNQAHIEVRGDNGYQNIPADVSLATLTNPSVADAYIQRDRLVRNVIDYIITELGCTYTITPSDELVDPNLDGVENFLFNTKEGYCVQYASSVALILRELGIPTRYADGYVASGLKKASGDFSYSGYVRDNNAHAWVEVWFDGVGWIQYEATPEYYLGMYGLTGAIDDSTYDPGDGETETKPPVETETETDPVETDPAETDPVETDTLESDSESETEETPAGISPETVRTMLIGIGVLVGLAVLAIILRTVGARASRAEAERQDAVTRALDPTLPSSTGDEDRRALAAGVTDSVMNLLGYLELSPQPGEFREEYADRLATELTAPEKEKRSRKVEAEAPVSRLDGMDEAVVEAHKRAERENPKEAKLSDNTPLPKIHMALEGMAAEEFGHGMTDAELREVASLYICLHGQVKRRIPLGKRIKLRYFKRKI